MRKHVVFAFLAVLISGLSLLCVVNSVFAQKSTTMFERLNGSNSLGFYTGFTPSHFESNLVAANETLPSSSLMWNLTYGEEEVYEVANSIIETSDGDFVVAAWRWDNKSVLLIKFDKFGNREWTREYGRRDKIAYEGVSSLLETSDGGYVIVGATGSDCWFFRINDRGSIIWSKTYGGADRDSLSSIVKTPDGGFAVAGYTQSFGAGSRDVWLIKTDFFGDVTWNKTYGGTGSDEASSVVQTTDGGLAIAGKTNSFGAGDDDFWLIKTDKKGNVEWNQTYGGTGAEGASSMVQTADGGFALAGGKLLIKTDANGVMEWNKTYTFSTAYNVLTTCVATTSDGGYAITYGNSLVKTDAQGNMQWNQTFDGTERRSINSLFVTSDGEYALAGFYGDYDKPKSADIWVIKTNEYGYIPEFHSWTILSLGFFTVTALLTIYRSYLANKKKLNPKQ